MGGVFINYRKVDNPLGAAGICDALARRFGKDLVFRDCVSMEAGTHYPSEIRTALENADVLVAVIGPQWLTLSDPATGTRLIDRPYDWVRRELADALERRIKVIPVLLKDTPEHARQPKPAELPDDIRALATIQAFAFSQRSFTADLNQLVDLIARHVSPRPATNGKTLRLRLPQSDLAELVTAFEAVPSIANDDTRALIINQLRPTISGSISHFPRRRAHVMGMLQTCLDYEEGLAELITAIRNLEQDSSIPFQHLLSTLARLLPEATDQI